MSEETTPQVGSDESFPAPSTQQSAAQVGEDGEKREGMEGEEGGEWDRSEGGDSDETSGDKAYQQMSGCKKCCGSLMNLFANDAIYGSFVGPHPVNFACICKPCRKCINISTMKPLCVASCATKVMNFLMLGVITFLATFFIIPWRKTVISADWGSIAKFFPCQYHDHNGTHDLTERPVNHWKLNGGCYAHAGYFMAYRCFLAFAFVMGTNFFAMLNVTSTNDDPYRKRIHHGFWLYKYLYLFLLLIIFFLCVSGNTDPTAYFEYTVSIMGNLCHVIFSFVELTFIMDMVDILVVSIFLSDNSWNTFLYGMITIIITIVDIICYVAIITHFAYKLEFPILELWFEAAENAGPSDNSSASTPGPGLTAPPPRKHAHNLQKYVTWPYTNCLEGKSIGIDWNHLGLIIGMTIAIVALIVAMALKRRFSKTFPFQGWMQVAVISLFNLFYLWSALFNSSTIHSRPRCNFAYELVRRGQHNISDFFSHNPMTQYQDGSHDTYFRYTGLLHGLLAIFTLFYFAFVHGPRSKTSPLSLGFKIFFYPFKDRIPVLPDPKNSPPEFSEALQKLDVWDDEQESVAQSWSMFYLMMILGGFSLMMSMTNFTDPWAKARYNSSDIAYYLKFFTAFGATMAYIFFLACPCTRVYKEYEAPRKTMRVVRKKVEIEEEEMEEERVVVIQVIEDDEDEVEEEEKDVEEVAPAQCGCLF